MKKLEKLTLKKLENEVALIRKEDANCIFGGVTPETMEQMMTAGSWTGGFVDGMGYVGNLTTITGGSYVKMTCTYCNVDSYGQACGGNTQGQQTLNAFNYLMHSLGFHENATSYDTIYYTK